MGSDDQSMIGEFNDIETPNDIIKNYKLANRKVTQDDTNQKRNRKPVKTLNVKAMMNEQKKVKKLQKGTIQITLNRSPV